MNGTKKLQKGKDRIIAGVASGLAEYFDVDIWLVRLVFILLLLLNPPAGIITYVILWVVMPSPEEQEMYNATGQDVVPPEPVDIKNDSNIFLGVLLITIGMILLLDKFFMWISWKKLWPVILIIIGVYIIYDQLKENQGKSNENLTVDETQTEEIKNNEPSDLNDKNLPS